VGGAVLTSTSNASHRAESVRIGAHRGAHTLATENTRTAFEAAIMPGVDFIETDVRRTADGLLVLHHDPAVFGELIAQATFDRLLQLSREQRYDLTTFDELLTLTKGRIHLDIELKEPGYEEEIIAALRRSEMPTDEFVITTFLGESLRRFNALYPGPRYGLLIEENRDSPALNNIPAWIEKLRHADADFVAPHASLVTPDFISEMQAQNYPVWVWTVDDPAEMTKFLQTPGVEAIITNHPDLALRQRSQLSMNRK
jgi:glycerophosphoryl diester phosphodiesterase